MTQSQEPTAGNASETNNSDSSKMLREEVMISGTPFKAVRMNDEWNLILGFAKVARAKSLEEIKSRVFEPDWELTLSCIQGMIDMNNKMKGENNNE